MTRSDQQFLRQVIKQRDMASNRNFKEVFVIHNLKNINTSEEYKKMWDSLCKMYEGNEETMQIKPYGFVPFYVSGPTRHVCLVNDKDEDFGRPHNDKVIALVKAWIDTALTKSAIVTDPTNPWKPIEDVFSNIIPSYAENVFKIQYKEGRLIAIPHDNKEVGPKSVADDKLHDSALNTFSPGFRIENTGHKYKILFEIPSINTTIKPPVCSYSKAGAPEHFGIKISGSKVPPASTTGSIDKCLYGEWFLTFDIPITCIRKKPIAEKVGFGCYCFTWEYSADDETKEEDESPKQ